MPRKDITLRDVAIFLHKHLSENKGFYELIKRWKAGHKVNRNLLNKCFSEKGKNFNNG